MSFCSTSATIVSGGLAERTYIEPYVLFSFLVGAFVYPMASAWVWGGGWLQLMGFHDFAGSGVVHLLGGFGALVGTIILGPRIGFFVDSNNDIDTKRKLKKLKKEKKVKLRKVKKILHKH